MKRIIHSLIFLAVTVVWASPQQPKPSSTVTDDEFQRVLEAVSNEDWDTTVGLSSKYLKQMKADDERLPRLRYIYLYAAAGRVSAGRMEFDDLAQSAKEFVGKSVAVPYRPITLECRGALNFICPSKDSRDKLVVAATNKTGTTILAFEYTQLKEPFDFASHEDEEASIIGTIEAIVPNPNKSRAIVMRLYISDAILKLKESSPRKQVSVNDAGQQSLAADAR
ncbi:MAG: hypothetical protein ND895_18245 [Pyrinomonadaceae bacterium]|nr:hypothetical protein [Pyrinomonadaceae bacterium]